MVRSAIGVAFDRSFSRLGHGKGYYDSFFASYITPERKPLLGSSTWTSDCSASHGDFCILVALAFREQLLGSGEVPMGVRDWKVDVIVSPEEMVTAGTPTSA
jgi:5-formyltetrahydrofolate cyclo-ligase